MATPLRIALIADIHHGIDQGTKLGSAALDLRESFTTYPYPTGAFGILALEDSLTVEVFGRDPALHRLPIKPLGHHWANLHRDFAPKPAHLPPRMAAIAEAEKQRLKTTHRAKL